MIKDYQCEPYCMCPVCFGPGHDKWVAAGKPDIAQKAGGFENVAIILKMQCVKCGGVPERLCGTDLKLCICKGDQ